MILAIFMLTAMVGIAAIAVPLINQSLNNSRSLLTSEDMLFRARGQSEYDLFFVMRNRSDLYAVPACNSGQALTTNNGVQTYNCVSLYLPNPYLFTVPAGQTRYFYLYDLNNPNDNDTGGVQYLSVRNQYGGTVDRYICSYNFTSCGAGSAVSVAAGNTDRTALTGYNSTRYQFYVTNNSSEAAALSIYAEGGLVPSSATVLYNGSSANGLNRLIRTTLP